MKVGLLYFSGTGATAKITKLLGVELTSHNHIVEYMRLKRNTTYILQDYDILGIGAPSYSFRAPRLVTKLLKKHRWHKKPFFLFCTSGGMSGNTLSNLYHAMKKERGVLLGTFEANATTNLRSWMPKKTPSHQMYAGLSFNYSHEVKNFIQSQILIGHLPTKPLKIPRRSIWTSIWTSIFTWRWQMATTVGFKRVLKQNCTKCGICVDKICPSGAIRMNVKAFPRFNEFKCVGCNGCVNLCPQDAVHTLRTYRHVQYNPFSNYIIENVLKIVKTDNKFDK